MAPREEEARQEEGEASEATVTEAWTPMAIVDAALHGFKDGGWAFMLFLILGAGVWKHGWFFPLNLVLTRRGTGGKV